MYVYEECTRTPASQNSGALTSSKVPVALTSSATQGQILAWELTNFFMHTVWLQWRDGGCGRSRGYGCGYGCGCGRESGYGHGCVYSMFTSCSWKIGGIPFCIVAVKLMIMISVAAAMNNIIGFETSRKPSHRNRRERDS